MIKALFLDMDETLCDTTKADSAAKLDFIVWVKKTYPELGSAELLLERYLKGVYKQIVDEFPEAKSLLPDEYAYRVKLLQTLFFEQGITLNQSSAKEAQDKFDHFRMEAFDFFPGVESLLKDLRKDYTLVVITNGPIFSQYPKLTAVDMQSHVDFIIVGGDEPEEKPAPSIFSKAMSLANVQPEEALHVGDSLSSDIYGANRSGIKSVWISKSKLTMEHDEYQSKPTFMLSRFTDIYDVLSSL